MSKVFFIGLGMSGSAIVSKLKVRAYDGIMIDCSASNMRGLKMSQTRDYYLLGNGEGTGGDRKLGKKYIEDDIQSIQPRLKNLSSVSDVVIIACGDSGVIGGQEVIIKEISKYAPKCKISLLTILPKDFYLGTLSRIVEVCKQNIAFNQQGIIANHIYVKCKDFNTVADMDKAIVDAMDNLFSNNLFVDKMSDSTLGQYAIITNSEVLIAGEKRNELMQKLRDELIEMGLSYHDEYIAKIKSSLKSFREKEIEGWLFTSQVGWYIERMEETQRLYLGALR